VNQKIPGAILTFCACWLALQEGRLEAFSLLGPYEPWMQFSNCFRLPVTVIYRQPGDIGGPMCISNGYRWNVPVVTYGFDPSFLNFFGTNGVAAVEGAIQILNDLPPASSMVLTNYPEDSEFINTQAQSQSLYDLQSVTLSLLLEQLGLASPTRSVFLLRAWNPIFLQGYGDSDNWPQGIIPQYVVMRQYDPETLSPTAWVNGVLYGGMIWTALVFDVNVSEVMMSREDSQEPQYTAVADNRLMVGGFYTGLTADDVGGLCYLYSTNNVNYEALLAGVSGAGTNANGLVNGAWRPGIDKITFVPHPSGSFPWEFLPVTNQYTDTFITNGTVMQQQVQRVISQPDFLFCAGDTGQEYPVVLPYARTGTTNWTNNASVNGNASGGGPGVIQPPMRIRYDKLGQALATSGPGLEETNYDGSVYWGTYDQSTNAPLIYPLPQSGTNQLILRLWFPYGLPYPVPLGRSVELSASGQIGASFVLQTSTNLTDWIPLTSNQINGSIFTLIESPSTAGRFYRLVPQ
jgi:hypothetical protein